MVKPDNRNGPQEPLIRLEQLSVEFGRHEVLRDIDLAVARGQTLAIIGESGCGKTVLLKTIIGLLHPTRGSVMFDGQDLARLGERALTRQRIRFGFVFQQAALFDSMTDPRVGCNSPMIVFKSTVLPQPLSPIMASVWPRAMARSIACKTSCRPNFTLSCSRRISGPCGPFRLSGLTMIRTASDHPARKSSKRFPIRWTG